MAPLVITLGMAVLDRVWEVAELPTGPGKQPCTGMREGGGGIAATAALAITALGGRAEWWGRLGADSAGDTLLEWLRGHGVAVPEAARMAAATTPVAVVIVDRHGERWIGYVAQPRLPADPSWLPIGQVRQAGAVMVDHRWVEGAERLLGAASHLPRVLDAEMGAPEAVRRLLPQVDHAVFSRGGLAELAGTADAAEGLGRVAALAARGAVLGVTLGEEGSLWRDPGGALRAHASPAVVARDTTGCGDVFHGAYALALAERRPPAEAVRFASAAAARKAALGQGWQGMPDRETVDIMMREEFA